MYLFIDTNIFLSFYHLTSDDLEELNKLAVLLREKRIELLVPEQVIDEFRRNREAKIADALKRLRDQKLNLQFPQICKDYEEYTQLRELQREYERAHSELLRRIAKDVKNEGLQADNTIQGLFDLAWELATSEAILERAHKRMALGNPPGKKGSLGDAVNWEAILEAVPFGESICFITDDRDYYSPLDENAFDSFLMKEWVRIKNSELVFYRRLSSFFRAHFPDIELASEYEKDLLIQNLANSGTFAHTHAAIARLNQFTDFSAAQVNDIVEAAISNNQVYWIIDDWDVKGFLAKVIDGKEEQIDPGNLAKLQDLLGLTKEEEEDIPF